MTRFIPRLFNNRSEAVVTDLNLKYQINRRCNLHSFWVIRIGWVSDRKCGSSN